MKSLVVIGGGAAGLMAAASARKAFGDEPLNITVVEKNQRPARKVMITGKGRCNVTNNCDLDTLIKNTPRNGKFLYSAFSNLLPSDVMTLIESQGVSLKTERGNRVFPVSDKAVDIVDALVRLNRSNSIVEGTVQKLLVNQNKITAVKLTDNRILEADAVIVATGGMSYPVTGSTGDGYKFANELGHTVTELSPSLVPLECHEGFCSKLSGLSLKNVTLSVFEEGKKKAVYSDMGEMLFTHFGISGPLVLSASACIKNPEKVSYTAVIDLKPALSIEQLDKRVLRDFSEELNKDFANSLYNLLPKSLVPVIIKLSGIPNDIKVNSITKEQRRTLCEIIKGLKLHIIATRPIEEAIITRGGIKISEIEPSTMRSKIVENLYFAGEIIDVDAFTGGFNLQIAFSTGFTAGKSVAEKLKENEI